MKLVLLSGGSGKRLWPLSNDSRSKQFIKVLKNDISEQESMVQRVWRQLKNNNLVDDSVIAASAGQVDMIHGQLGNNVPIVIEPERRDTFPAIALAASYLYSELKSNLEEVVVVLPVDPFVEDKFFTRVKDLENKLNMSNADLALIGVKPTYPSEKYGYIVPNINSNNNGVMTVTSFIEKPNKEIAEKLINNNALWNCGVFGFKLSYLINILNNLKFPTDYKSLLIKYRNLPKNSFDYEIVEKAKHIITLPYDGYWKDLGTWNTLTEEISTNIIGKGIIGGNVKNSHIVNELDIPIALIGVNNVVIAASPDGILITDKEQSPKVKEYVEGFDGRPMYEERLWGWYRVLDYTKYIEGNEVLTKRVGISAGKNLSYQVHFKRSEIWSIVKGQGIIVINDNMQNVTIGDVIQIPKETRHAILASTDMEFIEVQTGNELVEEDVHRIESEWDQVLNLIRVGMGSKSK